MRYFEVCLFLFIFMLIKDRKTPWSGQSCMFIYFLVLSFLLLIDIRHIVGINGFWLRQIFTNNLMAKLVLFLKQNVFILLFFFNVVAWVKFRLHAWLIYLCISTSLFVYYLFEWNLHQLSVKDKLWKIMKIKHFKNILSTINNL